MRTRYSIAAMLMDIRARGLEHIEGALRREVSFSQVVAVLCRRGQ
jgi:hypothetical protein